MTEQELERAVNELVDAYRNRCLWFMRDDYYPDSDAARRRVLSAIERHGDVAAFKRAGELRKWLSPISSATSAAS